MVDRARSSAPSEMESLTSTTKTVDVMLGSSLSSLGPRSAATMLTMSAPRRSPDSARWIGPCSVREKLASTSRTGSSPRSARKPGESTSTPRSASAASTAAPQVDQASALKSVIPTAIARARRVLAEGHLTR